MICGGKKESAERVSHCAASEAVRERDRQVRHTTLQTAEDEAQRDRVRRRCQLCEIRNSRGLVGRAAEGEGERGRLDSLVFFARDGHR